MIEYDINKIADMTFESNEIPQFFDDDYAFAGRLTAQDIANMPDETKDIGKLKRCLSEIFNIKLNNNYAKLEADCDIKRDTFQKVLRAKNGRNITYTLLAKFCVGAKLSEQEARELFLLMGHELNNQKYRCDYILICELKNGCDILEFDADLKKYGIPGILSETDNLSDNGF